MWQSYCRKKYGRPTFVAHSVYSTLTVVATQRIVYNLTDWLKPKFHFARHVTSRHNSTRSTRRASRDERVEPCCSNMADDEQALVLARTRLVVFMLLQTQILFVPSNEIH